MLDGTVVEYPAERLVFEPARRVVLPDTSERACEMDLAPRTADADEPALLSNSLRGDVVDVAIDHNPSECELAPRPGKNRGERLRRDPLFPIIRGDHVGDLRLRLGARPKLDHPDRLAVGAQSNR